MIARSHEMSANTIHTWLNKHRKNGSVKTLPKAKDERQKTMGKQYYKAIINSQMSGKKMVA